MSARVELLLYSARMSDRLNRTYPAFLDAEALCTLDHQLGLSQRSIMTWRKEKESFFYTSSLSRSAFYVLICAKSFISSG
jgi:hypothetical protein